MVNLVNLLPTYTRKRVVIRVDVYTYIYTAGGCPKVHHVHQIT